MKHTPTPWKVIYGELEYEKDDVWGIVETAFGRTDIYTFNKIVETDMGAYGPRKEDAEFIVAAVNSHEAMKNALELYLRTYFETDTHPTASQECIVALAARAALAKANPKP